MGVVGGVGRGGDGEFEDGFIAGGGVFLGEMAEDDVFLEDDGAGVGRVFAEDQGEEVDLPAPLGPTRPMRSSRLTCKEASSNSVCCP